MSHVDLIIDRLLELSDNGTKQFNHPYDRLMARVTTTVPFGGGAPLLIPSLENRINGDPRMAGKIEVGMIVLSYDRTAYHVSARALNVSMAAANA